VGARGCPGDGANGAPTDGTGAGPAGQQDLQTVLLDELGEAASTLERVSVDSFSLRAVKGGT
jgi:hypothetical protein